MQKPWTGWLVVLAGTLSLAVSGFAGKERAAMMGPDALFDLLPKLWGMRPFSQDQVTRLTGVALKKDASASNPFFHVFRSAHGAGPGTGSVTGVELRAPVDPTPGKEGLIVLQVSSTSCIRQKDVISRFGAKVEPMPPSAHGPPDALTYLAYHQEWGDLRFGFAQKGKQCLGAVVLDALVPRK